PRRGPEDRAVDGCAGEAARGPEKEVGFQRRLEEETGSFRDPHRRRASFARRESRPNEEDERPRPVGMTQRELRGGGSAGGGAEDRRAIDSEGVQERGVRVGLRLRRRVVRKGRAKVSESRRRDDAEAFLQERPAEEKPLVVPPAGSMDQEQGRT